MKRFALILFVALAAAALIGCGGDDPVRTGFTPGQTVEAYNYVHGGYIGQAVVTVTEDGVLDATLDEAFMPHTLAIVDMDADEWTEDNTVYYLQRGNQVRVAKHIAYDGTNYVGTTVGGALIYVEADDEGNPAGNVDLELQLIRNEASMAAWFENIADGKFVLFTEFGGEPQPVTTTSYGSLFKRDSTYWNFGIGWMGNIEALEEAVANYGTGFSLDEMVRRGDDRWALADAVTGATLSDFPDYFGLVQMAVGRLSME
ncbi:hypothetical protein [Spirochaeta africana]|uniref:Lipoprotein n=1 Tax=Spirochaeta africana (strain ATCC 700263 / DSM 8902 / Z-7692) TaxID=889378 RepID=H9ULM4_SPIAZ|nr:hypothetical protein [Spirochaeta africana]AFG38417.1 hypothetical protein Spiaf_2386 [Spirochaeta africana DSM 8902]